MSLSNAVHGLAGTATDDADVLASLLYPLRPARFFSRIWEKRALIIRREYTQFYNPATSTSAASSSSSSSSTASATPPSGLFSKAQFEETVARLHLQCGLHFNAMRYDKQGRRVDHGQRGKSPSVKELRHLWTKERVTFQVLQPQKYSPQCWRLNQALEQSFGCLVGNNAYITPANTQGLAPHWDDIEVIVLQLEGDKRWRLYEPPAMLQREYSPDFDQAQIGEPFLDITLHSGDLMYFPRGTIHQAVAVNPTSSAADATAATQSEKFSHHLTVSTYQKHAWTDFLSVAFHEALQSATEEDIEFRRGLPVNFLNYMGAAHSDPSMVQLSTAAQERKLELRSEFVERAHGLLAQLAERFMDFDATADSLGADFVAHRLPPPPERGGLSQNLVSPLSPELEPAQKGKRKMVEAVASQTLPIPAKNLATAAQISSTDCSVVLKVHPSHLRLVMEVADDEDDEELVAGEEQNRRGDNVRDDEDESIGSTQCNLVYSLKNRVEYNMDGRFETEPGLLRFPGTFSVALAALICHFPEPVQLSNLPMISSANCLTMAKAMATEGLLSLSQPATKEFKKKRKK